MIYHKIVEAKYVESTRGVAINLLQMAKQVGPQYEAAEYEDLPREKNLTLDCIVVDD